MGSEFVFTVLRIDTAEHAVEAPPIAFGDLRYLQAPERIVISDAEGVRVREVLTRLCCSQPRPPHLIF